MTIVSPTQSDVFASLGTFIASVVACDVIQSQTNRVPEPSSADFVLMNAVYRKRLATNFDTFSDCFFSGTIAGTTMVVTEFLYGTSILLGRNLFGVNVAAGSKIVAQVDGTPGGVGSYTIAPSQTLTLQNFAAGVQDLLAPTEIVVQCDIHGPNSADNTQIISTTFRDQYAVSTFKAVNPNIVPLFAEDAKQMPFWNENQQVETRWVLECHMQCNATVELPQQFFDEAVVGLINVDVVYPP